LPKKGILEIIALNPECHATDSSAKELISTKLNLE
jgi:hypothetical protein